MRIKHLARINPSKSECDGLESDQLVSFIPMDSIGTRGEIDAAATKALDEVREGYTYVADGDVLLAKITPCFENGKCAIAAGFVGGIGFATTEVIPIRPVLRDDARFLYYLLTSEPFRTKATAEMYGAGGQKRVPERFVKEYQADLPRATARQAISDFLDHETARIDTLIAKQKELIELLKEKRQAVTSQAVTKGLDPDVPMKDSGVEWLGKAPEHWEVSALKWKAGGVTVGIVVEPSKYYVDDGVPCLRSLNVSKNELVFERLVYISLESHALLAKSAVHEGDVVVVRTGQPGTAASVPSTVGNLNCIDLVIVRGSASFNPQYLSYQINSDHCQSQIGHGSGGALQQHFNVAMAAGLVLCFPPIEEQVRIVNHLRSACDRFESLIAKAVSAIDLLTERRTALISAAVTGQIDVATYDAPRTDKASAA